MKHEKVGLDETGCFSRFFLDYLSGKEQLNPFYGNTADPSSFKDQIDNKSFPPEYRSVLVSILNSQYKGIDTTDSVRNNINALQSENTFTVTTGHQLNLFTGPMYVIYKLITIIRTCEQLSSRYPNYNFVPIYWMASEDHDFDEINHFFFNGTKYEWLSEQSGAVGRFELKDLQPLLKKLPAVPPFFHHAYDRKNTLAKAVREYMNTLFGEYGLVVLDADNQAQKELLKPVMKADILEQSIAPAVRATTRKLEELGYSTQINARDINFFYLSKDGRFRIEADENGFVLVDGEKTFTRKEMAEEIESHPDRFSPNVVLRPLYQELILPNLAYVGGPSELVYWLQLKEMFDEQHVQFPILMPRNFGLVLPHHIERKRESTNLPVADYFKNLSALLEEKVLAHSENDLSLEKKQEEIDRIFREIFEQATSIDVTLGQHVEAQQAKLHKVLGKMEKKFIRAEKRNHDDMVRQVKAVRDYIFPGGNLQERHENFLNFYQNDSAFIDKLMKALDPFSYEFNIFIHGE